MHESGEASAATTLRRLQNRPDWTAHEFSRDAGLEVRTAKRLERATAELAAAELAAAAAAAKPPATARPPAAAPPVILPPVPPAVVAEPAVVPLNLSSQNWSSPPSNPSIFMIADSRPLSGPAPDCLRLRLTGGISQRRPSSGTAGVLRRRPQSTPAAASRSPGLSWPWLSPPRPSSVGGAARTLSYDMLRHGGAGARRPVRLVLNLQWLARH